MPCCCSDFLRCSPSAWAPRLCLARLSLRCMPALSCKQACYCGSVGCFIFMSARCSRSPAALRTGASAFTERHLRQSLEGALRVPFRIRGWCCAHRATLAFLKAALTGCPEGILSAEGCTSEEKLSWWTDGWILLPSRARSRLASTCSFFSATDRGIGPGCWRCTTL